ncbi:hypothetical protein DPM19_32675 [Actinomadura craniellae]|uniref:Uncharacterized protein n=1 Tax=Actinomadura craniellae TaxID=2231787 RepID=A0A365GW63_9ACTN|nr:hypothetical protein [Actinomadura craniellae]RAY11059.1 hypothetical protein DPM19_32675 [Actinomadura craniellae]
MAHPHEERESPLSAEEIVQIQRTADPALRNLRITHAYHLLAVGMAGVLGGRDATWGLFGTWASRTAGRFIRGELGLGGIRPLPGPLPAWAGRWLLHTVAPHVGANVAEGNRLVFAELGPLFHTTITAYAEETDRERALARVLETLTPGPIETGGQDLLIAGMRSYHRALSAPGPAARAQAVLLANLQISLHEQTRLQEAIAGSLAPPLRAPFTPAPVKALAARVWSRFATGLLMDLNMPAADFTTSRVLIPLRLGRDVGGAHGSTDYPADLAELDDVELKALLYDLDRTPDSLLGSAATDWTVLAERLNYLADLFRLWQQDPCLHQPPFTPEQSAAIRSGHIPGGPPL